MRNENMWNAHAEVMMMGHTLPVDSVEHLTHLVAYVYGHLFKLEDFAEAKEQAKMIIEKATTWCNSNNTPISHVTVNRTVFGTMLTFVRDEEMESLTSQDGVLTYVYNLDAPDCSELGYAYFEQEGIMIRRVG